MRWCGRGAVRRIGVLAGAVVACHSTPAPDPPAPVAVAVDPAPVTRPACLSGATDSAAVAAANAAHRAWTLWPLDSLRWHDTLSAGVRAIRLPAMFQPIGVRPAPDGTPRWRWMAPDSTMLTLWVSDLPTSEVGGSGVAQFAREGMCALQMPRGRMLVTRYWTLFTGRSDTTYNAAGTTVLVSGPALDASISARSRAARDTLLTAIAAVELPPASGLARASH
jgi:hypothetical protein